MLLDDPRHGSENGYHAHRRDDENACAACRQAHSDYTSSRRRVPEDSRIRPREARREDLLWMVATGENADNAARRLGLSFAALERWAQRHMPDIWQQLLARRPRDWNQRINRDNQQGRVA